MKGGNRSKLWQLDRRLVVKRHVRTKEVVMGHKECGQDHRAVVAVEPGSGLHMILISPVQALNELLKCSPLF